ncbi:MAG: hypothetical protein HY741_06740 [Chloroflexi bacterium]|nr:hypothetical protein [Chloroflexota bacterium]
MDAPPPSPERPSTPAEPPRSSIDIRGGDVQAGRDIVGGDVNVAGDSISAQNVSVQRGFSADQVQRLVLIVGGLVFVTAACFFIFGALSAAAIVNVISRPLPGGSPVQAAIEMQQKIDALNSLEPGQRFRVLFKEEEISAYFRHIAGPKLGISNGKARLMDEPGQIALGGNLDRMNGMPFLAQVQVTTTETPLEVEGAWIKLLPTPEGMSFGWIPVTALAQDFSQQLNAALFGKVHFTQIGQTGGGSGIQPEIGTNLLLTGAAK